MTDEQRLLANAVLDGEATTEELARADADAGVQAELTRLRSLRTELADVTPLPAARRDAILAAALDTFDAGSTARPTARRVVAPPPASLDARRRARWLMPAAAAVLGVVAVGGIIALGSGGGDNDESGDAMEAGGAAATEMAPSAATLESAVETGADVATEGGEIAEDGTVMVNSGDLVVAVVIDSPDQLVDFAMDPDAFFSTGPADTTAGAAATTLATEGTASERTDAVVAEVATCAPPPEAPVYLGTVRYGAEGNIVDVFADTAGADVSVVVTLGVFDCVEVLRTTVD